MSDIPVGSPPAPPGRHAAPGGWYVDPVDSLQERYWDGWQWSRNTRPREAARPTPQRPYGAEPQNPYAVPTGPVTGGPAAGGPAAGGYPMAPAPGSARAASTADGVALAGWWRRVLATLIDGIITSAVIAVLGFSVYRSMIATVTAFFDAAVEASRTGAPPPPTPSTTDLISRADATLLVILTLAVGLAYQLIFLRWKSATPGKIVCGLRVVPVDQGRHPGPLGWSTIVFRALVWVLPNLSAPLLVFQLADAVFPIFHPKRQALHDLGARTQVVRSR